MGGGSFTAVQGEGEQYSCIRRASSVTLTICFQFCKVKLDQSATENLFRLFFHNRNLWCFLLSLETYKQTCKKSL